MPRASRRVRYLGLARNRCHLNLICAAINLRGAIAHGSLTHRLPDDNHSRKDAMT